MGDVTNSELASAAEIIESHLRMLRDSCAVGSWTLFDQSSEESVLEQPRLRTSEIHSLDHQACSLVAQHPALEAVDSQIRERFVGITGHDQASMSVSWSIGVGLVGLISRLSIAAQQGLETQPVSVVLQAFFGSNTKRRTVVVLDAPISIPEGTEFAGLSEHAQCSLRPMTPSLAAYLASFTSVLPDRKQLFFGVNQPVLVIDEDVDEKSAYGDVGVHELANRVGLALSLAWNCHVDSVLFAPGPESVFTAGVSPGAAHVTHHLLRRKSAAHETTRASELARLMLDCGVDPRLTGHGTDRLERAIYRYSRSAREPRNVSGYIDLAIAVEGLLPNCTAQLRSVLIGLVVGTTPAERKQVASRVKDGLKARNAIVHGEDVTTEKIDLWREQLPSFRSDVRDLIEVELRRRQRGEHDELALDLLGWLDIPQIDSEGIESLRRWRVGPSTD